MKREILFRAKSIETGEWIEGNFCEKVNSLDGDRIPCIQVFTHGPDSTNRWIEIFDSNLIEVDPKTINQFTGLEDKNGVRIFDGDVVRWHGLNLEIHYGEHARFMMGKDNMTIGDVMISEIIGNIHDNPELLQP